MKRKGAEQLKRYMADEDWLPYLNRTQSQTRLYKHLSCNGRTQPILHFSGWLIAITIFTNIPNKITAPLEYDYFPSRELSEKKQAKKIQGLVGADFEDKFAKAQSEKKAAAAQEWLALDAQRQTSHGQATSPKASITMSSRAPDSSSCAPLASSSRARAKTRARLLANIEDTSSVYENVTFEPTTEELDQLTGPSHRTGGHSGLSDSDIETGDLSIIEAQINDLKKDGKAKDSRMDKFQAQLTKIDVRSLRSEKRTQEILKLPGPKPSQTRRKPTK
ncbi:uncharacterized protein FIESC28_07156 [Fusarium coffeatum]|uniref:Uncharacterized protein n=1 Tax=Fusarium coffeatum TaxID=231269 RepID=A0A366RFK4_9HYPO|nr:uncharacterized protein FIESC28_07156 [Fusarium coffeatum]RBR15911.1 hypothetical protein FIESC28_07156 [Fusarium coffeatum]